jgi:hypothetical protein
MDCQGQSVEGLKLENHVVDGVLVLVNPDNLRECHPAIKNENFSSPDFG